MGRRRFARLCVEIVIGIGTSLVALAPPASAVNIEQYIEVPQCQPATSQDCKQIPQVPFDAGNGAALQVSFTANANHCSDIEVRFLVDGYPVSDRLRVGPAQTVTSHQFIESGAHELGVAARGVPGGCNTGGVLNAWGGTVHIISVGPGLPAPRHQG